MSQIGEGASPKPRYAVIDLEGSKNRAWNGNYADFFRLMREEFALRSSQNLEEAIRKAALTFTAELLGQKSWDGKGVSNRTQEAFSKALETHRDTMSESDVAAAIERDEDSRQRFKSIGNAAKEVLADLNEMALTGPPKKIARLLDFLRDLASSRPWPPKFPPRMTAARPESKVQPQQAGSRPLGFKACNAPISRRP